MATEVVAVSEDAQGGGAVLLIRQGNLVGAAVLLDPPLAGRAALKLSDDAGRTLEQGLTQRRLLAAHVGQFLALGSDNLL